MKSDVVRGVAYLLDQLHAVGLWLILPVVFHDVSRVLFDVDLDPDEHSSLRF